MASTTPEPPSAGGATQPSQREIERRSRSERTSELFRSASSTDDPSLRELLLDEVTVLNIPVCESVASRYRGRGIAEDDLNGVARLALVRAVRRFDVDAGHDFLSYAVPTIRGEIKRYFRDAGWVIRPPRRVQEVQTAIAAVESDLSGRLGRSPGPAQLADALGVDVADVEEALAARGCFVPDSLDRPLSGTDDVHLTDVLGAEDPAHRAAEARAVLGPVVSALQDRDRRIIELRFFDGLTQREIAADLGVTQMQVSRLLARILRDLRRGLTHS